VAIPLGAIKTLTLKDTAYTAFNYFNEYNIGLLPVMEKGKMKGVVTRRMVMQRLMWGMKSGIK
jgi:predicted transcriptional regulator